VVTLATKQPSANIPGRPRSPPKAGFFTARTRALRGLAVRFDAFIEAKEGEMKGGWAPVPTKGSSRHPGPGPRLDTAQRSPWATRPPWLDADRDAIVLTAYW